MENSRVPATQCLHKIGKSPNHEVESCFQRYLFFSESSVAKLKSGANRFHA